MTSAYGKNKERRSSDGRPFNADFAELRAADIDHPNLQKLEAMLETEPEFCLRHTVHGLEQHRQVFKVAGDVGVLGSVGLLVDVRDFKGTLTCQVNRLV